MNKQIPYLNNQDRINNGLAPKNVPTNRHHILPSSRLHRESMNVVSELFMNLHSSWHGVNGNAVVQEALEQFAKINGPVLSDKYRKDIEELIQMPDEYVYKNGIYIKR